MIPGAYHARPAGSWGGGAETESTDDLIDPATGLPLKSQNFVDQHFVDYSDTDLDQADSGARGLVAASERAGPGGGRGLCGRILYGCDRALDRALGRCGLGSDQPNHGRRRAWAGGAFLVLCVITLLSVALTVSARGGTPAGGASSTSRDGDARFEEIKERILGAGVTRREDLEPPTSPDDPPPPQLSALNWIAREDPMRLETKDLFLLQRYALAVFWYATFEAAKRYDLANPPDDDEYEYIDWDRTTNWMTEAGICAWHGVSCHHRRGTSVDDVSYDDNNGVTHLNLTENDMRGTIPREVFTVLTDLRVLFLDRNQLTGSLADELGGLGHLEQIHVGSNYLTGTLPSSMGELNSCQNFYASDNLLTGTIPIEIGGMAALRELGLYENSLTGTIPVQLDGLVNLDSVYIDSNKLSGTLPTELGQLYMATDIRLRRNELTGTIPTELAKMDLLEVLYLDSNQLRGTIPKQLGQLEHLEQIFLYKNLLTGTLPSELGKLSDLDHMYLDHNLLMGTIPPEFAGLSDVRDLFLYDNSLSGTIPPEAVAGMEDLRRLRLHNNTLTGTLPSEMGALFNLQEVELQNNGLGGAVPEELGELVNLVTLRIHGNDFTGTIPYAICELRNQYELDLFVSDCVGVTCQCCSQCV